MQKSSILYANQLMLFVLHQESFSPSLCLSVCVCLYARIYVLTGIEFISFGPYTNKMIKKDFCQSLWAYKFDESHSDYMYIFHVCV